jgi:hypothetical protein
MLQASANQPELLSAEVKWSRARPPPWPYRPSERLAACWWLTVHLACSCETKPSIRSASWRWTSSRCSRTQSASSGARGLEKSPHLRGAPEARGGQQPPIRAKCNPSHRTKPDTAALLPLATSHTAVAGPNVTYDERTHRRIRRGWCRVDGTDESDKATP